MMKFKVYRAITLVTLLISTITFLMPARFSSEPLGVNAIATMVAAFLFIICYTLLVSIFNFYKEPLWKKLSIWFFVIGIIFFNYFIISKYADFNLVIYFLPLFYLPMAIAFLTMKQTEIKPLAQSFAYIFLIVCIARVGYHFLFKSTSISYYSNAFDILFRLPMVLIVVLFHKMVSISKNISTDEEIKYEGDLL